MKYIKVEWVHSHRDEPRWLYSELDDESWETRKVEVFPDGSKGYADHLGGVGTTELGVVPVPPLEEIALDPQFVAQEITRQEFEQAWLGR
jgi:hypothetical protein